MCDFGGLAFYDADWEMLEHEKHSRPRKLRDGLFLDDDRSGFSLLCVPDSCLPVLLINDDRKIFCCASPIELTFDGY